MDGSETRPGSALAREVRALLADVDVISFDVFDTLFVRPMVDPEHLFDVVGAIHGIEGFRAIRQEAQRSAFGLMLAEGRGEITLQNIYDCLPPLPAPADVLRDTERTLELEATVPNREVTELFAALVEEGRRVVLASDMYFQADFFEELLRRHDLPQVPMFISADCNRTKRDHGSLFDHLAETLGVPPGRILHIGDNVGADIEKARARGLMTFHYLEPHAPVRRKDISMAESVARGVIRIHRDHVERHSFHELGFLYGGPAATGFLDWILDQAEKAGVDRILFVSRDGFVLNRMAALRREAGRDMPPCAYLRGSRVAFTLAAMSDAAFGRFMSFLLSGAEGLSVPELFTRIGVEPPAERVLADLGLGPDVRVAHPVQQRVVDLVDAMRHEILKVAAANRRGLFRHLLDLGVRPHERVAFVDIGWNGTTQEAFELALDGLMPLRVTGLYLCLTASPDCLRRRRTLAMRALVEPTDVPAEVLQAIHGNRVIAEFFFSAPHGAVIGYRDQPGPAVPVEDLGRSATAGIDRATEEAIRGMLDFGALYSALQTKLRFGSDPQGLAAPLLEWMIDGEWASHPALQGLKNFDSWALSANRDQVMRDTAVRRAMPGGLGLRRMGGAGA